MSKKPKAKTKAAAVVDENAVTRAMLLLNYGKMCKYAWLHVAVEHVIMLMSDHGRRSIGVHVNTHINDVLKPAEEDTELVNVSIPLHKPLTFSL